MKSITITLPLPPAVLSPNSRAHWSAVSRAKSIQRHAAKIKARARMASRQKPWLTATVAIRATFADNRQRDRDNILASLKAAFDGTEDAGLIANDSGYTYLPVEITPKDPANPRIEITFTKQS